MKLVLGLVSGILVLLRFLDLGFSQAICDGNCAWDIVVWISVWILPCISAFGQFISSIAFGHCILDDGIRTSVSTWVFASFVWYVYFTGTYASVCRTSANRIGIYKTSKYFQSFMFQHCQRNAYTDITPIRLLQLIERNARNIWSAPLNRDCMNYNVFEGVVSIVRTRYSYFDSCSWIQWETNVINQLLDACLRQVTMLRSCNTFLYNYFLNIYYLFVALPSISSQRRAFNFQQVLE